VHGLDVRLKVGVAEEEFVAVLGVFGTLEGSLAGMGTDVFLETAGAREGFGTAFVGAGEF
jgi:hypothetical protein